MIRHTPLELDLLALRIHDNHRKREPEAIQTRWWDYQALHPVEATYRFAELYRGARKRYYVVAVDERLKDYQDVSWPRQDVFSSRDMTTLWLARQAADLAGIPYEFVMYFAHDRFLNRFFNFFPQPNQLYGEEFDLDLQDAWKQRLAEGVRWASNEEFKASNYSGQPIQDKHIQWVLEQVKTRPAPQHRLLARLMVEDVVPEAAIAQAFNGTMVDMAHQYARLLRDQ